VSKWRLLVVDDEPLNLEIIAEFLEGPDYGLDMVQNPLRALEKLEAPDSKYDLIVLDRMMPGMNGIELLRRIKTDERFRHVPVIMQTAASSPEQIREGIEAGAYYYLTKPYEPQALLAIVHAALDEVEERSKRISAEAEYESRTAALRLLTRAEFEFSSLDEAQRLADLLASLCPVPATAVIGLAELLVNAVEHGNLGISYADKSRLRLDDGWEAEVARRLESPEYRGRVATVCMERDGSEIRFTIADRGNGFSWQKYLEMDPARAFDPNGRGIALARQISFSSIEYRGCGNVVLARLPIPGLSAL
jgi:CheY-like chemotaxis protein/anti-sigma regulatory factor (Ser/Thr protein kinase)